MFCIRYRTVLLTAALLLIGAGSAAAQIPDVEAQLTLSVSPDELIQEIAVSDGDTFSLHVVVAGLPGQEKVNFDVQQFHWSVLEACCGSAILLQDVIYNPSFTHEGHPFAGVISSSDICLDDDIYSLATLRLAIDAPESGAYEVLLYPLDVALDCDGGGRSLLGTGATIFVDFVPNEGSSWSSVKALYR
jgi:hypothetical protein